MSLHKTLLAACLCALVPGAALAAPIHDAAAAGDVATVMSLIKGGVSPDALNDKGETPLIVASRADQREVANVLVQFHADATLTAPGEITALHAAAAFDDANLIYVLATGGGDVNARDAEGTTPLMIAAGEGMAAAVMALRGDWHAELEIADNAGKTALTRAGLSGKTKVVTILLRLGAVCQTVDAAWYAACTARRTELGLT